MAQPPAALDTDRAAPLGPFRTPQIAEAQRRFWLIVDAMLAALVVLALVGGWAWLQVRDSLREVRAAGLASLLEAEARVVELWIEEKKRDAERWAEVPLVRREAAALAALAAREACGAPAQRALRGEIERSMKLEEVSAFNLVAPDGRIVSSTYPEYCGRAVTEGFRRRLDPVFEGRTVFVPPVGEDERLGGAGPGALEGAVAWVETPVRGEDGRVVAALGFGRLTADRFAGLLAASVSGTSREAYAFDARARMLTTSRFARELSQAGLPATEPLALAIRDPGGDVLAGHRPAAPDAERPLTALAAAALEHRDGLEGAVVQPYRNYRGAEVIGAWRWLPEARMGVAVEVQAAEAYGALEHLQVAFAVLFGVVLVAMTAAASTSLWAVRMRMREARRVGPYRIEREIGEGGMSNVYLARHALLRRPAAVKVLKPHLATDEAVARFRREAQLCSQLEHPGTVEVYDHGTTRDGRWYYAMEYLHGLSIQDLVRDHGPMPVCRVVHALRQACGALAEAHARGWVHRDVKPGNIMLCVRAGEHDVVKLVDFGLVKQTRNPDTRDITQYSKVLGTPLFMAPERLRNPADADARADIYALGAVAYFAITGRAAFEAETDHDIVYRVMHEPVPDLPGVPPALAALVARCLEKDRAGRPGSIEEVREVLDAVAAVCPWTEDEARAWWQAHGTPPPIPV